MAFLRVKKAGNRMYAYLVESRWDSAAGHPRQRVIAYLGRADRITIESVPALYRTPSVLRTLDTLVASERARVRIGAAGQSTRFVEALLAGDRPAARTLARRATREMGPEGFISEIFVPSLHEIGRRFAHREISISAEHLATGVAATVLTEVNTALPEVARDAPEVVLCVPEGETHTLALQIAEGLLRRKGYRTLNVGGSAPTTSVLEFVRARRPRAVLVSVTMPDRLEPGWRLARRLLRDAPGMRVAIGGQGTSSLRPEAHLDGVDIVRGAVEEYLHDWPDVHDGQGTALARELPSPR